MAATGFGVIGVGVWGEVHAKVYAGMPGGGLAAVCDADGDRARKVAETYGAKPYTDYREMLADENVLGVSIVLPDFLHRDAAVAAAEAKKHIFVEKPLATTEEDCIAMIRAAKSNGVRLSVDFTNRFSPLFNTLKQALDAGELGDPQMIYYRLSNTTVIPTKRLRWAGKSSVAWFLGSHCLDMLLWLMNARGLSRGEKGDTIERLYCVTRSRLLGPELGITTPDFYQTTLEWKSGLVAQLENCWILPASGPTAVDMTCQFVGSKGGITLNGSRHGAVQKLTDQITYPDTLLQPVVQGRPVGFAVESIRRFAECVMHEEPPPIDGEDGLAVTRLILKMEESARTRQPVEVGNLYDL